MKLSEKFNVIAMVSFYSSLGHRVPWNYRYKGRDRSKILLWTRELVQFGKTQCRINKNDSNWTLNSRWRWQCSFPCLYMAIQLQVRQGQRQNSWPIIWSSDKSRSQIRQTSFWWNRIFSIFRILRGFKYYWLYQGLVLNKKMKWVVFHGSSDFAYLLRLVHGE